MSLNENKRAVDTTDIQIIKFPLRLTMVHLESPRFNLDCHFDNQLYLIPGAAQDDVDDSVDVGDVDFAITVHVGSNSVIISA